MSLLLLLYGIETEEATPTPPVPPVIVATTGGAVGGGLKNVIGRRPGVYTGIFAEWIERDDEEIMISMSEFLQ